MSMVISVLAIIIKLSMKKISIISGILAPILFSTCIMEKQETENSLITIEIDYGAGSQRTISTEWENGLTALEALQHVATVKTHPVGQYVFVTVIDSVEGVRGYKAWYYTINGKPTNKIAINRIVRPADTISWIYKTDVCSGKVDNSR